MAARADAGAERAGDDVYLAKRLEEAVAADERTAELGIRVSVKSDRLVLQGTVATASRKDAVERVVRDHAADKDVVNDIVVADPGEAAAPVEERLR